jgi:subtilase family serine protease
LHDFRSKSASTSYDNGAQQNALVPGDLAKIYNALPLYASSIDGSGQSIAVIGRSNIDLDEVRGFRATYGLPVNDPKITVVGMDPGVVAGDDAMEAHLDVEYAGAIAKNATIEFVVAGSTAAMDGIYLSALYAVSHNVAPIVSVSYGLCEALLGTGANAFMSALWQQAAAQGMSVFVASMDNGAAGCDPTNAAAAASGRGVNGFASTPFNTAVGGTQFDDASDRGAYWAASNDPVSQASALGYIPELAWNDRRREFGLRQARLAIRTGRNDRRQAQCA